MNAPGHHRQSSASDPFYIDHGEGAETGVYLALLELIDEGLIITSDELIIDANSAACSLLERDYRELAGQFLHTLFTDEQSFLDARARLFIQGQRRSEQRFSLGEGRSVVLNVLSAPRLRPGIHALILSPLAAAEPPADDDDAATSPFAPHLDRTELVQERPSSLFDGSRWPHQQGRLLESQLWQALERNELELQFQPLIDCRRKSVHAGEALLRWRHPSFGLLVFSQFRAILHDSHLIARIGSWVLEQACTQALGWVKGDGDPRAATKLAVNVATEQLLQENFIADLAGILERSGLSPHSLELDLDESVLETDNAAVLAATRELAAMGIRLAIDDFGRGLSSIPRLRRYPVSALKLDPQLVLGVGQDEDSEACVEAISSLAACLNLEILARGVKTAAQRDFLSALGCTLQQGPLYGPPMSAAIFSRFRPAS